MIQWQLGTRKLYFLFNCLSHLTIRTVRAEMFIFVFFIVFAAHSSAPRHFIGHRNTCGMTKWWGEGRAWLLSFA